MRVVLLVAGLLYFFHCNAQNPISPSGNIVASGTITNFSWSAVPGANSYVIEISRYNDFPVSATYSAIGIAGTTYSWNHSAASPNPPEVFYWRVKVSNGSWSGTMSYTYVTSINYYININQPSAPITVCAGEPVYFSGSSNYQGAYSWALPGATPSSLSSSSGYAVYDTPGVYNVTFKKSYHTVTETGYITVVPSPSDNIISATNNGVFCAGDQTELTTSHIHESGDTYQWLLNGVDISGQTSTALTVNTPGAYSLEITGAGCASVSNVITAQYFNPDPVQASPTYYCSGGAVELVSGSPVPNATYAWYQNGQLIQGETDSVLAVSSVGAFYVVGNMPGGGCSTVSDTIDVLENSVYPVSEIGGGDSLNLCEGTSASISVLSGQDYTYRWSLNGDILENEDSTSIEVTTGGVYVAEVNYRNCVVRDTLQVVDINNPVTTIIPQTNCDGMNQYIRVDAPGAVQFYWSTGEQTDSIYIMEEQPINVLAINEAGCSSEANYTPQSCYCISDTFRVGPNSLIPDLNTLNTILANPCTMTAPAVFQIESGHYDGVIEQEEATIPGNSETNTVTFESVTGNPDDVVIDYYVDSGVAPGTFHFEAQYMNLRGITFRRLNANYNYSYDWTLVEIGNNMLSSHEAIYNVDNIKVIGDSIAGIKLTHCHPTLTNSYIECNRGLQVRLIQCDSAKVFNNVLNAYTEESMLITNCNGVHIKGNRIYGKTGSYDNLTKGIQVRFSEGEILIERNLVQIARGSGIWCSRVYEGPTSSLTLSNNMVCVSTASSYDLPYNSYGMVVFNNQVPTRIYHNSITNTQKNLVSNYWQVALRVDFDDNYSSNIEIKNNILHGSNKLLYLSEYDPSYDIELDYNNWYQMGTEPYKVIINNIGYQSVNSLVQNTPYADHKTEYDPDFIQSTFNSNVNSDLHAQQTQLRDNADATVGVMQDFDGYARYLPDRGANEQQVADIEISTLEGLSPSTCDNQSTYDFSNDSILTVTLTNNGAGPFPAGFDLLVSCSVNSVVQITDTIALTSDWQQGETIDHTFSNSIYLLANGPNDVEVSIGHYDMQSANDIYNQLVGNFESPVADFSTTSLCQDAVAFDNLSTTTSGSLSYEWDFGDGQSSTLQDPIHGFASYGQQDVMLTALSSTGCTGITTQSIDVLETPDVSMDDFSNELCVTHNPIDLTGGSPSGGSYSGIGVSGSVFNPAASGSGTFWITYSLVSNNGCVGSDSTVVTVNTCASIDETDHRLRLYPNPTTSTITLQTETPLNQAWLTDLTGRRLMPLQPNGTQWQADLSQLPSGMYLIDVLTQEGRRGVKKVVKE